MSLDGSSKIWSSSTSLKKRSKDIPKSKNMTPEPAIIPSYVLIYIQYRICTISLIDFPLKL